MTTGPEDSVGRSTENAGGLWRHERSPTNPAPGRCPDASGIPVGISGWTTLDPPMRTMPTRPDPTDGESLYGWVLRAAHRAGDGPAGTARRAGLVVAGEATPARLSVPPDDALKRAALVTGIGKDRIEAMTLRTMAAGMGFLMSGAARSLALSGVASTAGSRCCPICVITNGTWQLEWTSAAATVCLAHRVRLSAVCTVCGKPWLYGSRGRVPRRPVPLGRCVNAAGPRGLCGAEPVETKEVTTAEVEALSVVQSAARRGLKGDVQDYLELLVLALLWFRARSVERPDDVMLPARMSDLLSSKDVPMLSAAFGWAGEVHAPDDVARTYASAEAHLIRLWEGGRTWTRFEVGLAWQGRRVAHDGLVQPWNLGTRGMEDGSAPPSP